MSEFTISSNDMTCKCELVGPRCALCAERAAHEQTKVVLLEESRRRVALESELADCKWYREALATEATDLGGQVDALESELAQAKPILESAEQYAIRHRIDRGVSHHNLINAAIAYARAKTKETKDGG